MIGRLLLISFLSAAFEFVSVFLCPQPANNATLNPSPNKIFFIFHPPQRYCITVLLLVNPSSRQSPPLYQPEQKEEPRFSSRLFQLYSKIRELPADELLHFQHCEQNEAEKHGYHLLCNQLGDVYHPLKWDFSKYVGSP